MPTFRESPLQVPTRTTQGTYNWYPWGEVRFILVALNLDDQGDPCRDGFTEGTASSTLERAAENFCRLLC